MENINFLRTFFSRRESINDKENVLHRNIRKTIAMTRNLALVMLLIYTPACGGKNGDNPLKDKDYQGSDTPITDTDQDSVPDDKDNCPNDYNPSQTNSDNHGAGDACDRNIDNDGLDDEEDLCPEVPLEEGEEQHDDSDRDNIGDDCDPEPCGKGAGRQQTGIVIGHGTYFIESDETVDGFLYNLESQQSVTKQTPPAEKDASVEIQEPLEFYTNNCSERHSGNSFISVNDQYRKDAIKPTQQEYSIFDDSLWLKSIFPIKQDNQKITLKNYPGVCPKIETKTLEECEQ